MVGLVTPPIPDPTRLASSNRSPGRDAIYTIYTVYILYCTGTLIDLFFLRAIPVPIGAQTISVITKIICTYTKELPPEWCPSQFIHIYKVPFTYTFKIFYYKNIRDCGSSAGEHLSLSRPALLMWNVLSSILVFSFCTYTD